MDNKKRNQIVSEAKLEINHQIDSFVSEIQNETSNPDEFYYHQPNGRKVIPSTRKHHQKIF